MISELGLKMFWSPNFWGRGILQHQADGMGTGVELSWMEMGQSYLEQKKRTPSLLLAIPSQNIFNLHIQTLQWDGQRSRRMPMLFSVFRMRFVKQSQLILESIPRFKTDWPRRECWEPSTQFFLVSTSVQKLQGRGSRGRKGYRRET